MKKRVLSALIPFFSIPLYGQLNGSPILDNNYRLDLRQGPIVGSAKQVALGGAYIGLSEGITSLNSNPAGVAFRTERSKSTFDWDWTAGANDLKSKDFDNNGFSPPTYQSHRIRTLGIMGQYGPWGIGLFSNGEILKLENSPNPDDEYVLNATSFALGRQWLDQRLTMGVGLRTTLVKLQTTRFDATIGKVSGVGWEIGALWDDKNSGFRFGAAFASSIDSVQSLNTTNSTSPATVNGLIVPHDVTLPWQLGLGVSYRGSSASFWKQRPWLLAGDLVFIGASENAVGIESVLAQKKQTIGADTTVSVRIGSELEAWPKRMRARLGCYYEPSFYSNTNGRVHLTGGIELRLFRTHIWGVYDWGLTYTIDSASQYLNNYLSIGFWHF